MANTYEYTTSGEYQLDIPSDAGYVYVELEGAGGGGGGDGGDVPSEGGNGGYVDGFLPQAAGKTINIFVGGGGGYSGDSGGFNGGGRGYSSGLSDHSGSGGGSSDIRIGGTTLSDRVVAAGAGGGGAVHSDSAETGLGGDGGGLTGEDGDNTSYSDAYNPGGGTQTAGGSGTGDGGDGVYLNGGAGSEDSSSTDPGGGGGAGWYGGGGGADLSNGGIGGAGGSSYIDELDDASTAIGGGASGGVGQNDGADGSVTVTVETDPEAVSDFRTTDVRETEIDLAWTVNDTDTDGQRIYRDTNSGVGPSSGTLVADLSATTSSYTDTNLSNGQSYYYIVETYKTFQGEELTALSSESSATTLLPAPVNLTVDAVSGRRATLSWDDPSNNTLAYQLHAKPDKVYSEPVAKLPADWWSARASNIDMDPLGITPFVRTEVVSEPSGEYETGVEWRDSHDSAYNPIDFTTHDKIRFYWYSESDLYPNVWIDGESNSYAGQVELGTPAIVEIPRSDFNIDWTSVSRFIIRTYGGPSVGDVVYIGGVDAYTDREVEYQDDRFFIDSGASYTVETRELFDGQQYDSTVETWTEDTSAREDQ